MQPYILDTAMVVATLYEMRQGDKDVSYTELVERLMRDSDHNQRVCEIAVRGARDEGYIWLGRNQPVTFTGNGKRLIEGTVKSAFGGSRVELVLGKEFSTPEFGRRD